MTEHVLIFNAGSSSIKFALFEIVQNIPEQRASGQVERIGSAAHMTADTATGTKITDGPLRDGAALDHAAACTAILQLIQDNFAGASITAIGHRVVHGGPDFTDPLIVDDTTLAKLADFSPFAPLHQPHNLAGIQAARTAFPGIMQVACFDTAFHSNHPWVNDVFAIPRTYYDKGVRRYGFHGLSYDYISGALEEMAPLLHAGRVVVAHLGNGASMCGMLGGRSVGSTMGLSALDGLPMGTRCGQIDPGVLLYMLDQEGMTTAEVAELLYEKSGLLGLSGLSNDMRTLLASDAAEAAQAIDYYVFRIRRELGALSAVLGGLDALVFTGGIGENSSVIRERVCAGMAWLGLELDHKTNVANQELISTSLSRARILVIPTDEEQVIARAACALITEQVAPRQA
ncbi:MAG: acetate/propionate family kinase [Roseobacter sp.]